MQVSNIRWIWNIFYWSWVHWCAWEFELVYCEIIWFGKMWSCHFFPKLQLHFGRMWNFTNTLSFKYFSKVLLPWHFTYTFEHSRCNYCQLIWLHTGWNFSFCLFAQASNKRVQTKLLPSCTKASYDTISNTSSLDSMIPFVIWNEAGCQI